jgi:hypothetical protein
LGYTQRGTGRIKTNTVEEMAIAMQHLGLEASFLLPAPGNPTPKAVLLADYFNYRSKILNTQVEPWLMNKRKAKKVFKELYARYRPSCPIPMNKQKGTKKAPAYLTGIVNMLIEANKGNHPVDYDPRSLPTFTKAGVPIRTLARRIDGCFPSVLNPVAIWEIKEYYNTTTFGSRVADGVYETLLDGLELTELREHESIQVRHYLIIDDHYTWWDCGRSYLCRIIDLLNMGYVDEVLFGYEVVERLPQIVRQWVIHQEKVRR